MFARIILAGITSQLFPSSVFGVCTRREFDVEQW